VVVGAASDHVYASTGKCLKDERINIIIVRFNDEINNVFGVFHGKFLRIKGAENLLRADRLNTDYQVR
jgi:hypothetical protein